jgi:hypothetical protein
VWKCRFVSSLGLSGFAMREGGLKFFALFRSNRTLGFPKTNARSSAIQDVDPLATARQLWVSTRGLE